MTSIWGPAADFPPPAERSQWLLRQLRKILRVRGLLAGGSDFSRPVGGPPARPPETNRIAMQCVALQLVKDAVGAVQAEAPQAIPAPNEPEPGRRVAGGESGQGGYAGAERTRGPT